MLEKLETLGSFTKFLIALVIYTGYLTWWAASVNSNILKNHELTIENKIRLHEHDQLVNTYSQQTIKLMEIVTHMSKEEEQHENVLYTLSEHQNKCTAILSSLVTRLEKIEDRYHNSYRPLDIKPEQWPSNNQ